MCTEWNSNSLTDGFCSKRSISISLLTESDGLLHSIAFDDSTTMSCLFCFFVVRSSTTTTGSTGGESIVKSIATSNVLFFHGINIGPSSHSMWLVVTCVGVRMVVRASRVFFLLAPLFQFIGLYF